MTMRIIMKNRAITAVRTRNIGLTNEFLMDNNKNPIVSPKINPDVQMKSTVQSIVLANRPGDNVF